jgi:hypothetical protein
MNQPELSNVPAGELGWLPPLWDGAGLLGGADLSGAAGAGAGGAGAGVWTVGTGERSWA